MASSLLRTLCLLAFVCTVYSECDKICALTCHALEEGEQCLTECGCKADMFSQWGTLSYDLVCWADCRSKCSAKYPDDAEQAALCLNGCKFHCNSRCHKDCKDNAEPTEKGTCHRRCVGKGPENEESAEIKLDE